MCDSLPRHRTPVSLPVRGNEAAAALHQLCHEQVSRGARRLSSAEATNTFYDRNHTESIFLHDCLGPEPRSRYSNGSWKFPHVTFPPPSSDLRGQPRLSPSGNGSASRCCCSFCLVKPMQLLLFKTDRRHRHRSRRWGGCDQQGRAAQVWAVALASVSLKPAPVLGSRLSTEVRPGRAG